MLLLTSVEDNLMNVITEKYLTTKLDEAIFSGRGTLCTIPEETLAQINAITEIYKTVGQYGKKAFSQEELFLAETLVDQMVEEPVPGDTIDNVLQPMSAETFNMAVKSITSMAADCPAWVILPCVLLAEVFNKRKSFYR